MSKPTIYNTPFASEFAGCILKHKHRRRLSSYIAYAHTLDPEVQISDGDMFENDKHITLTFFNFSDLSRVCIETGFGYFCAWQEAR